MPSASPQLERASNGWRGSGAGSRAGISVTLPLSTRIRLPPRDRPGRAGADDLDLAAMRAMRNSFHYRRRGGRAARAVWTSRGLAPTTAVRAVTGFGMRSRLQTRAVRCAAGSCSSRATLSQAVRAAVKGPIGHRDQASQVGGYSDFPSSRASRDRLTSRLCRCAAVAAIGLYPLRHHRLSWAVKALAASTAGCQFEFQRLTHGEEVYNAGATISNGPPGALCPGTHKTSWPIRRRLWNTASTELVTAWRMPMCPRPSWRATLCELSELIRSATPQSRCPRTFSAIAPTARGRPRRSAGARAAVKRLATLDARKWSAAPTFCRQGARLCHRKPSTALTGFSMHSAHNQLRSHRPPEQRNRVERARAKRARRWTGCRAVLVQPTIPQPGSASGQTLVDGVSRCARRRFPALSTGRVAGRCSTRWLACPPTAGEPPGMAARCVGDQPVNSARDLSVPAAPRSRWHQRRRKPAEQTPRSRRSPSIYATR